MDVGTFGAGNPQPHSAYSAAMQSTGDEGVTIVSSDTPLPLRMADPAVFSNDDQPQPRRPQSQFDPGGPVEPPFPPLTRVVADSGASIETTAAVGSASGVGAAQGVGASIAAGAGGTAHRNDASVGVYRINGEAPDVADFAGRVTSRRTVIIRTVLSNRVAVQLTALSLLAALDLKIEMLRAGGSNSEITEFDDLKRRVEEFLAANEKAEETAIADTTLSIADGLRRYWTERYERICDLGLAGLGLSFCAAAGAFGVSDTNILAVTALAGGDRVVGAVKAAADLVWGKGDKGRTGQSERPK
jgi:hypothetical protein